ncbi:hypothetical protein AURDEDRAFT_158923 [Auricularia subglabra TFB-10046 SS5]|nr:hypothetical protein AURDEDRAFT_158923 [Auricularia subglabra TFB-10046 SS5]
MHIRQLVGLQAARLLRVVRHRGLVRLVEFSRRAREGKRDLVLLELRSPSAWEICCAVPGIFTHLFDGVDASSGLQGLFDSITIVLSTPFLISGIVALVLNLIIPEEPATSDAVGVDQRDAYEHDVEASASGSAHGKEESVVEK